MKWVALLETKWALRHRILIQQRDSFTATRETTGVGVEVARAGNSVLVWLPRFNHVEPGTEESVKVGYGLIETTSNLVRDATPEEIAAAGGEVTS